jgi:pimeloyl-ACP methyl ester carboxylesterase
LFEQLAADFRVTAWDNAASPCLHWDDSLPLPTMDVLSLDLQQLMQADGMRRPHIVTWCAGAMILLWSRAACDLDFGSVTFIAPPSVLGRCPVRTGFQTHFLQLVMQLGSGTRTDEADLYRRIQSIPKSIGSVTDVDRAILELTSLPMRDEAATKRYARLIRDMCNTPPPAGKRSPEQSYAALFDELCQETPVALIHSRDDDAVSWESSAEMASRNAGVRLFLYPDGSHFVIFREPERIARDVAGFVRDAG